MIVIGEHLTRIPVLDTRVNTARVCWPVGEADRGLIIMHSRARTTHISDASRVEASCSIASQVYLYLEYDKRLFSIIEVRHDNGRKR